MDHLPFVGSNHRRTCWTFACSYGGERDCMDFEGDNLILEGDQTGDFTANELTNHTLWSILQANLLPPIPTCPGGIVSTDVVAPQLEPASKQQTSYLSTLSNSSTTMQTVVKISAVLAIAMMACAKPVPQLGLGGIVDPVLGTVGTVTDGVSDVVSSVGDAAGSVVSSLPSVVDGVTDTVGGIVGGVG
ncbi:unnamed protein product [Cyclocybe aegerita]|uniref:Uncharacterized protein n=1 Tax=Cyclocybe aegerita TaxID=1973307 RepID=A0A8S0VVT0_CYCAE|nr:unnamed protein product [Cyclocybe aegerita]